MCSFNERAAHLPIQRALRKPGDQFPDIIYAHGRAVICTESCALCKARFVRLTRANERGSAAGQPDCWFRIQA